MVENRELHHQAAVHALQLCILINTLRSLFGLVPLTLTDPTLASTTLGADRARAELGMALAQVHQPALLLGASLTSVRMAPQKRSPVLEDQS